MGDAGLFSDFPAKEHSRHSNVRGSAVHALRGEGGAGAAGRYFAFPGPEDLLRAGERGLRACGTGYRAPYLLDAARRVADGRADLDAMAALPDDELLEQLEAIHGVGREGGQLRDALRLSPPRLRAGGRVDSPRDRRGLWRPVALSRPTESMRASSSNICFTGASRKRVNACAWAAGACAPAAFECRRAFPL